MRVFIALDVPDRVRQQVLQVQQTLGQMTDIQLYPEPYSNLHMTLAYLGEQSEENIVAIRAAMAAAEKDAGPVSEILLSGPNEYRELDKLGMLVFADNGHGQEYWSKLNYHLGEAIGYTPQFAAGWLPHITLVRFGERPNLQPTLQQWEPFHTQSVHIYQSERQPSGGARYVVVSAAEIAQEAIPADFVQSYQAANGKLWGEPLRFSIYTDEYESKHPYHSPFPGLAAFIDVFVNDYGVEVAYASTDSPHRNQGYARQLIQHVYNAFPDKKIYWGKIMHDAIDHLRDEYRQTEPDRTGKVGHQFLTKPQERYVVNAPSGDIWQLCGRHAKRNGFGGTVEGPGLPGICEYCEQEAEQISREKGEDHKQLTLAKIAGAQFMYHMSPGFNRESILEHGLNYAKSDPRNLLYNEDDDTSEDGTWPRGQYLFVDEQDALQSGSSQDDIYEVNVEGLNLQPDSYLGHPNEHAAYTSDPIEPERLRLLYPAKHMPTPWWEERTANIFDPIQKELDQKVFTKITPKPTTLSFIHDNLQRLLERTYDFPIMEYIDLYLTGSLTTYQYDETSDCDISVFVDWDSLPEGLVRRRDLVALMVDKLDGTILPGTQHPIQHFVVGKGIEPTDLYKPGLRSAYSFQDNDWVQPPERERVHDVANELPILYHRAQQMAEKMELLLNLNPIYAKEFWHQIHRKRQKDQQAGLGDFSEGNIVYKYLLHNGYFDRIRSELGEVIAKTAWLRPGPLPSNPISYSVCPNCRQQTAFEVTKFPMRKMLVCTTCGYEGNAPKVGWKLAVNVTFEQKEPYGDGSETLAMMLDGNEIGYITYGLAWDDGEDPEGEYEFVPRAGYPPPGVAGADWGTWKFIPAPRTGPRVPPGEDLYLDAMWIDDEYRRQGYATMLVNELMRRQGVTKDQLSGDMNNSNWPDGGAFWKKFFGPKKFRENFGSKVSCAEEPPEFAGWNPATEISTQVIYDYEGDRIILVDHKESHSYPPGQFIGEYLEEDVILNDHHQAWLSPKYFSRLWTASFPDRPLRNLFIEADGEHHRIPLPATLRNHGEATEDAHRTEDQEGLARERAQGSEGQLEGVEALQVDSSWKLAMPEMFGNYMWPTVQEIQESGQFAVEDTGQAHPGWYDHAEGALDAARGAAINRHVGVFGSGGTDDAFELAAHLIWRIQDTQAAVDGNKRTGTVTGLAWLDQHGYDVTGIPDDDSLFNAVNDASQMEPDEGANHIAEYLRQYVVPDQEEGPYPHEQDDMD